jgi:hypothetical protein
MNKKLPDRKSLNSISLRREHKVNDGGLQMTHYPVGYLMNDMAPDSDTAHPKERNTRSMGPLAENEGKQTKVPPKACSRKLIAYVAALPTQI